MGVTFAGLNLAYLVLWGTPITRTWARPEWVQKRKRPWWDPLASRSHILKQCAIDNQVEVSLDDSILMKMTNVAGAWELSFKCARPPGSGIKDSGSHASFEWSTMTADRIKDSISDSYWADCNLGDDSLIYQLFFWSSKRLLLTISSP